MAETKIQMESADEIRAKTVMVPLGDVRKGDARWRYGRDALTVRGVYHGEQLSKPSGTPRTRRRMPFTVLYYADGTKEKVFHWQNDSLPFVRGVNGR